MSFFENCIAARLRRGEVVHSAWSSLGVPVVCETLVKAGFSAVTVDMQHGMARGAEARDCISAIAYAGGAPVLRVCVGDFQDASWMLDVGAQAIIAPMINSAEEARQLVGFCKYPPVGARSFGPFRAGGLHDIDMIEYQQKANEVTLALAMIETPDAVEALDDILAVDGLDGVFVGPADLSLTVSAGEEVAPTSESALKMQADIARRVAVYGKVAGMYCVSEAHFQASLKAGYRFLVFGADAQLLTDSAVKTASLTQN
ncbi:HpcH/HpaI aldolase family protein [Pseudovibrio exalbescens]|nr:aldolase/citrate lyase family protein [Pseudovibrio exalbescens]